MQRSLLAIGLLACGCKPAVESTTAPLTPAPSEQHLAEAQWNDAATPDEPAPQPDPEPAPPSATEDESTAWDRENFSTLAGYVHDLQCLGRRVHEIGVAAAEADAGTKRAARWQKFKRDHAAYGKGWYDAMLAKHPDIASKSMLFVDLRELHALAIVAIPGAYDSRDAAQIDKVVAKWAIIEVDVKKYALELEQPLGDATSAHCAAMRLP